MLSNDSLKDLLPEARERRFTYTTHEDCLQPQVEQYLVSIGNTTGRCNSVYLIIEARVVNHKDPRSYVRKWALKVLRCPDLLSTTHYNPHSNRVWVGDDEAHPIFWNSRNK